MIMAMSQQIAPTKFHQQVCQQDTEITTLTQEDAIDPHLEITIAIGIITIKTGTGLAGPDPVPITTDIGVTVTVTHEEVVLDPTTDPHTVAHHASEAQAHIITNETPHTTDPNHAEVSPETTVDLGSMHHTNTDHTTWKTKARKHKQVTIDDPPSEYYSSDEQASNSEDDLN